MVQFSHPYMTTWKTIALTRRTFVDKVMSLLFNMLSRFVIAFLARNKCLMHIFPCVYVCIYVCACVPSHFSCFWLFAPLWTVASQAPLSLGFSNQEHWSGLPCPPPGDLPSSGIQPASLMSPALAGRFFTTSTTWEAHICWILTPYHSHHLQIFSPSMWLYFICSHKFMVYSTVSVTQLTYPSCCQWAYGWYLAIGHPNSALLGICGHSLWAPVCVSLKFL